MNSFSCLIVASLRSRSSSLETLRRRLASRDSSEWAIPLSATISQHSTHSFSLILYDNTETHGRFAFDPWPLQYPWARYWSLSVSWVWMSTWAQKKVLVWMSECTTMKLSAQVESGSAIRTYSPFPAASKCLLNIEKKIKLWLQLFSFQMHVDVDATAS